MKNIIRQFTARGWRDGYSTDMHVKWTPFSALPGI